MSLSHHHHSKGFTATSLSIIASTFVPDSTASFQTLKARASCEANSKSAECETPVKTNGLAIGLGVGIPFALAFIALIYLHLRHMKKLKKEEEESKDIDIDNDEYDPSELATIRHKASAYTLNSAGEKVPAMPIGLKNPITINTSVSSLEDPFHQSPYQIPELSSSQRSLNNYDRYDMGAYPPSGSIYQSSKFTSPIPTRPSSPSSVTSNPYSHTTDARNHYGLRHPQAPDSTSSSLRESYPPVPAGHVPYMNTSRVSSTLSVVSSHTPTLQLSSSHPPILDGEHAVLDHSDSESLPSMESGDYSDGRQPTALTVPDDDDDEARHDRIEQKLDREIYELEADSKTNTTIHDASNHSRGMSQFSFTMREELNTTSSDYPTQQYHQESHEVLNHPSIELPSQSLQDPESKCSLSSVGQAAYNNVQTQDYNEPSHQPRQYVQEQQQHHSPRNDEGYKGQEHRTAVVEHSHTAYQTSQTGVPQSPASSSYTAPITSPVQPAAHTPPKPLPKLSNLPTPHKLDDSESTISYAPQRRNQTPTHVPVYSPLHSPTRYEEKTLPSPSQLGMSSDVFSSTDFIPPKKFIGSGGNRSRSNSLTGAAGQNSLRPESATPRGGARPPSELVPDVKSQLEKLRPQLNMR